MPPSSPSVHGLHHVTVIAGDPQENLDFYTGVLGMRLVKRSVNQDAPETYHLFYADGNGTPGTALTFFPWPDMAPSRRGAGQAVEVSLAVRPGSLDYWSERLADHHVRMGEREPRFGGSALPFTDPHGLPLALVETGDARDFTPWVAGPVPEAHQVRGLHAIRIWVRRLEPTEALLTEVMGFQKAGEEHGWYRYGIGGASGTLVDVQVRPGERKGRWGPGAVHHAAWRTHDDKEELSLREAVQHAGLRPSKQINRFWFRSVYFREPGGVLFELATDGPGFDRDEAPEQLGKKLILPPWMEANRDAIEAALPTLKRPAMT